MKKIKLITGLCGVLLLSACTAMSSFMPPTFDNVEYSHVITLDQQVQQVAANTCSIPSKVQPAFVEIGNKIQYLQEYTKSLTREQNTHKIFALMNSQFQQLQQNYALSPSSLYCKGKMIIFHIELQRVITTMAKETH